MRYFIRFTDTIESDIERGTSIITVDNNGQDSNEIVNGLCAFGYYNSIEECHAEAAKKIKVFGSFNAAFYAIVKGYRSDIEGSIGCIVEEPELVSIHKI